MRIYKEVTAVTKQKTKLICDKCLAEEDIKEFKVQPYIAEFSHSFGFGSKNDLSLLEFDLCEDCLFEILEKNNINYKLKNND